MTSVQSFTFNPFQENTYVLFDASKDCVIIDPGCSSTAEQEILLSFIKDNNLKPVKLLNTHCHIDHILGNKFCADVFKLPLQANKKELRTLDAGMVSAQIFGIHYDESPLPEIFLDEPDTIVFGESELQVLFTPGHSEGSICFYNQKDKFLIGGDVLFFQSIGRTDLPGGNHQQLLSSIKNKLFNLPEEVKVYPGHGPATTLAYERMHNPFLN